MRILWVGNAAWCGSGYGEQANLFVRRLQAVGHEVAILANFGIQGTQITIQGIHYYPSDGKWANPELSAAAKNWKADLIVVLHDAWVMHPDEWDDDLPPVAIWAPVDHCPLPPAVHGVLSHERIRPIAMSRFGLEMMTAIHIDATYVPHGIDTNLFRPNPEIRAITRAQLDIPEDAFLVGIVAANRGNPETDRKSFGESFDAFSRFAAEHDDAYLYVHSQIGGPADRDNLAKGYRPGAIDLEALRAFVGLPANRIRVTPADAWKLGIPREYVATLYQAFDVLLMPSMGEGFGIPLVEAQASGVPVITSPHSAMQELCGAGWLVDGQRKWDAMQSSFFFLPYTPSIQEKLELAYEARGDRELRQRAVEFAQAYDADRVTETFWKPALDKLGAQPRPSRAERRRTERAAKKHPAPGRGAPVASRR